MLDRSCVMWFTPRHEQGEARAKILSLMCEGVSIRAITRLTGASKNTVARLLADVGRACAEYQDNALRNLPCKRGQLDEIWAFIYAKNDNVKGAKSAPASAGDVRPPTCRTRRTIMAYRTRDS